MRVRVKSRPVVIAFAGLAAAAVAWASPSAATPSVTTLFTTQIPAETYSVGPYELGMKWRSSEPGVITKMSFFRARDEPEDGGEFYVHLGHIWDEFGNLLATVPFAGATGRAGEGWETVALIEPLPIDANTTYVVSVNVLSDYVATPAGLSTPVTNGPLSSVADGNNGVYSTTPASFPTQSYNNTNYFVDVEFEWEETPTSGTLFTTEIPQEYYSDGPYELGTKWRSSQSGVITKMRFFRALDEPKDGGEFYVHLGHIWDEFGNLLATVPFAGATGRAGEGWETVALIEPLPIEAATTYVVSVNVLSDYVSTSDGLAEPVVNGPLSTVADGNNGVYSTTPGEFPTKSWFNSNYFVDVEVEFADTPVQLPESATVFTTQTPAGSYSDGPYELGMKWRSSEPGVITKMSFFRALDEPEDGGEFYVHVGRIWDEFGNLLATVPFAGATGRTGEGWETVALFEPLPIDANTTYVVSVNVLSDYVATPGGLAYPVVNGPLSSVADGNNGVFSTTPGAFPTQSHRSANYFVDVEVAF